MSRWKEKLKQYEKEHKPSFWEKNKIAIIVSILVIVGAIVALFLV